MRSVSLIMGEDGWIDFKPYTDNLTVRALEIRINKQRVTDLGKHKKAEAKAKGSIRMRAQSWNIANLLKK